MRIEGVAQPSTAIVIGLARRQDRREFIATQLSELDLPKILFADDLGLMVDWRSWSCKDLDELRERVFPWRLPMSPNYWWSRELRLGEIGCTLSHWNVWKHAWDSAFDSVLILEDDAVVSRNITSVQNMVGTLSKVDPSWGLLYLGRERLEPDRAVAREFVVPGFSYCTFGYVLSRDGIEQLLQTDLPGAVIPVDEFLPAMYMDHPRPDVHSRFPARISAYALRHDIVSEGTKDDLGSDTEDSPFLY